MDVHFKTEKKQAADSCLLQTTSTSTALKGKP